MRTPAAPQIVINGPEDLGRTIAMLRRSRGASQDDVSKALGIPRLSIIKVERGGSVIMLRYIFALLRFFDVSLVVRPK